ncbi:hypothetical protein [Amphibiibacter pelophylacis]|uniref:Uncharacterized protein n=1 Tax=Amphibiibacter pelophylacis TaxID=1799477 RepID=A0ACC6P3Q2_9BURK
MINQQSSCYHAFLQAKVDAARASAQEGNLVSNEDVEAFFATQRAALAATVRPFDPRDNPVITSVSALTPDLGRI